MNRNDLDLSVRLWSDYHQKEAALKRMYKSIVDLHRQMHIDKSTMRKGKRLSKEGRGHEVG